MEMVQAIILVLYATCGAMMRLLWGIYKAEEGFLYIRLSGRRMIFEFLISFLFGIFGGALLTDLGLTKVGINFAAIVSSVLGANVIDVVAKKFGYTKSMQVVVSDQQLLPNEFNLREMNALKYFRLRGKITNQIYQKINQTTHDIARHELKALVDRKKLKEIGSTKGAFYMLP